MKNFIYVAAMALVFAACGNGSTNNAPAQELNATEIVPAAATEVLPAASPGPDAGGKVATEVIPNEPAK